MEKQDLSNILIKDSEYYNPKCTYAGVFKRNNITTINQILDDSFLEILNKCHGATKSQLTGFITMLKHKYLYEPLCGDALLDKKIDLEYLKSGNSGHLLPLLDENANSNRKQEQIAIFEQRGEDVDCGPDMSIRLTEFLGCPIYIGIAIIEHFTHVVKNASMHKNKLPENPRVIDFLKWVSTVDSFCQVVPYVNTYIEEYEKNQNLENVDYKTISILKDQLTSLVKKKEEIDAQIISLQQQIEVLSNNKGDMKR